MFFLTTNHLTNQTRIRLQIWIFFLLSSLLRREKEYRKERRRRRRNIARLKEDFWFGIVFGSKRKSILRKKTHFVMGCVWWRRKGLDIVIWTVYWRRQETLILFFYWNFWVLKMKDYVEVNDYGWWKMNFLEQKGVKVISFCPLSYIRMALKWHFFLI